MADVTASEFIRRCAEVANAVGGQAGVGGMELAGQIVSVLAANPEHLPRFMAEGAELFIDGTLGVENGLLTYVAISGDVLHPSVLLEQKKLAAAADSPASSGQ